jgi:hypothetical protein
MTDSRPNKPLQPTSGGRARSGCGSMGCRRSRLSGTSLGLLSRVNMDWADIERLARDSGLEVDALRQAAAPAIAFSPAAMADSATATGCYFGGLPMLPDRMRWPTWSPARFCEAERQAARRYIAQQPSTSPHWMAEIDRLDELEARGPTALQFLAQLDLDQLASVAAIAPLPSTGKLLVFAEFRLLGAASRGRADPTPPWHVVWFSNELKRSRAEPPAPSGEFAQRPWFMVPSPIFSFPHTVKRGDIVVYEEYLHDDYTAFLEELARMGVRGQSQVGGHVLRVQDGDIPTAVNHRYHGYDLWDPAPADVSDRLAASSHEWKFLFQIGEDYGTDLAWSGVASFWGRPQALAAHNFGDVELHFEDT